MFLETFARDVAALFGYSIPVLLMCSAALTFGSWGVEEILGFNLGFNFSYLSYACAVVVGIGATVISWRRVLAIIRRRKQVSDEPPLGF